MATALLLLGGSACAQLAPADADAPRDVPGQVLSDVQPLPAEDRDSHGAVLLHQAPVRARQGQGLEAAADRSGLATLGRAVQRLLAMPRSWADVADAGEGDVPAGPGATRSDPR